MRKTSFSGMWVAVFVWVVGLFGSVHSQAAFATTGPIQMCSGGTMPAGYVVTQSAKSYKCTGYLWTLNPVVNGIQACLGSKYPSPYFITSETSDAYQCTSGGFAGSMRLNLPSDGMTVCVNGVVWSPWVITANGSANTSCNGYGTVQISKAYDGIRICKNSPIPSGWYTSGSVTWYQCSPYSQTTLYKAQTFSRMPTGTTYEQHGDEAVPMSGGRH